MRKIKTSDKWQKAINDQKKSGLSVAGYARQNNINPSTLQYWSKKFKNTESTKMVKLERKPVLTPKPTLLMINTIKLEIPSDISSMKIAKLISVIRDEI